MDTHEVAWAAGFFDGEGNIRAKRVNWKERSYLYPVIFVPQIHPYVLERFKRAVGFGKISGPFTSCSRDGITRQPQWVYEVFAFEQVQAVCISLYPWLSPVKRAQVSDALLACRYSRDKVA
jgi:hypothetical protein